MDAKESQIYTAVIAAVTVLGSVVIYFIYNVIRQHRKVLALERESTQAQITVLEKDRSRIAADLHDDLAPMLVSVKMKINSFDLSSDIDCKRLESTNTTIDDIARRMRSISFDLMPSTLGQKGLVTAFHEFVNSLEGNDQLKVKFIPPDREPVMGEQNTIHTYRILQEIVHNTIKHSGARELVISLRHDQSNLTLSAWDNGRGFDLTESLRKKGSLGLKSMLNRIHLLGAHYKITSRQGEGTHITIQIPVQK